LHHVEAGGVAGERTVALAEEVAMGAGNGPAGGAGADGAGALACSGHARVASGCAIALHSSADVARVVKPGIRRTASGLIAPGPRLTAPSARHATLILASPPPRILRACPKARPSSSCASRPNASPAAA